MHCLMSSEEWHRKIPFTGYLLAISISVPVVDLESVRRVASGAQKVAYSDGSGQQNAGDGNPQGSPFGRFAWPCGFSAPVFNSLPAEIGNIRYTIFRDNAGLLSNLEDAVEFFAQRRHILPDFVIGNLGVDLGRGDMFMSQHLADRFQRYALRKRDRCGKGMPRHVDRRIERQTGMSGNMT